MALGDATVKGIGPDWWVPLLTKREFQLTALVAAYPRMSENWLGRQLGMHQATVNAHFRSIYLKLLIHARWQLAVLARAVRDTPASEMVPAEPIGWPSGVDRIDAWDHPLASTAHLAPEGAPGRESRPAGSSSLPAMGRQISETPA